MAENGNQTEIPVAQPKEASFPWAMLCVAALFDLIGLIPIINLLSEILAGLIICLWQKFYNPKIDPMIFLLTFLVAKIIDAISLGILPSNIGVVIYAYTKKKAAVRIYNSLQTSIDLNAANKILKELNV